MQRRLRGDSLLSSARSATLLYPSIRSTLCQRREFFGVGEIVGVLANVRHIPVLMILAELTSV